MKDVSALHGRRAALEARIPGMALAAALAIVAAWVAGGLGEPLARNPVLVAMLLGLLLGNTFGCPDSLQPGLDFTKRYLLRLAVALVGVRISVRLLSDLGIVPIAVAALELLIVLVVLHWIGRKVLRLDRELSLLIAAGSAICGAAAVLCVAAVIRARAQHAGIAIALITLAGTLALLLYPVAFVNGALPGLDDRLYGVFVGASIFELAQVYGASFAISEGALNTATVVKLSKVLMLVPLLLVLGAIQRRRDGKDGRDATAPTPFPWFVLGFIGVVLLNSAFTLHPQARRLILDLDQFLFLMVMIALGLNTRLSRLGEGGMGLRLVGAGAIGLTLSATVAYALVDRVAGASASTEPAAAESLMMSTADGRAFASVGCAKCHVPSLRGREGLVTLYSDLLLHDMGPALDDKIVQGSANGSDWRTRPLVGLKLRQRYLHDGRAATLRDAILIHGGESQIVRDRFLELDDDKQQAVYRFLSLL